MRSQKEQAEIYRIGLMLGFVPVPEVIAWCDAIIMAESSPDIGVIEASISGSRGRNAVASALFEVGGEADEQSVIKEILGEMYDLLKRDRTEAAAISHWLYKMASDNLQPDDDTENDMWRFWDAVDLASEGTYGYLEGITNELLCFLQRYKNN